MKGSITVRDMSALPQFTQHDLPSRELQARGAPLRGRNDPIST